MWHAYERTHTIDLSDMRQHIRQINRECPLIGHATFARVNCKDLAKQRTMGNRSTLRWELIRVSTKKKAACVFGMFGPFIGHATFARVNCKDFAKQRTMGNHSTCFEMRVEEN
jgi:hypothetical protein